LKLLLDSNVLLWAVYAPEHLTEKVRLFLEAPENDLFVSHASIWELLEKIGRGKLLLAGTSPTTSIQRFMDIGITLLPIELTHIQAAAELPQHHSDPFDRVILAQAIEKGMPILTSDGAFERYPVEVIWR
jgi:PIN domain nuclease of toxin-antitoxin system